MNKETDSILLFHDKIVLVFFCNEILFFIFSVQAVLRERVIQDGPYPGREHTDLSNGPR